MNKYVNINLNKDWDKQLEEWRAQGKRIYRIPTEEEIATINSKSEEDQFQLVYDHGSNIKYLINPSEKCQLEAVQQDPYNITYIKTPCVKAKYQVVEKNIYNIRFIDNPSRELYLAGFKALKEQRFGFEKALAIQAYRDHDYCKTVYRTAKAVASKDVSDFENRLNTGSVVWILWGFFKIWTGILSFTRLVMMSPIVISKFIHLFICTIINDMCYHINDRQIETYKTCNLPYERMLLKVRKK